MASKPSWPPQPLPFRALENVRARHKLMVSLHQQGLSLQECADTVGLFTAEAAGYHINGKCRCDL